MRIDHLFLVAVKTNGLRMPIPSVRPRLGETPLQAAKRVHFDCQVVHDPRPWLLLAGDQAASDNWIQTNRIPRDRVRVVLEASDIPQHPEEWQVAAVGHWIKRSQLRTAMIKLLMTCPVGGAQERTLSSASI